MVYVALQVLLCRWLIQQIECYSSLDGKDKLLSCHDKVGKQVIQNLIQEFNKYDVEVSLVSIN